MAADTSANSPQWAAISPNARHKSRQRCPCGKKLSVALISPETDALDILTSGVNNTNSKKEKKKERRRTFSRALGAMLHPDNTVYTLLQLYNYKVSFFSDRSPERVFFFFFASAGFCLKLELNQSLRNTVLHRSAPKAYAGAAQLTANTRAPWPALPSSRPLGLRTMYGDVTPRLRLVIEHAAQQTARANSWRFPVDSPQGEAGRAARGFFFFSPADAAAVGGALVENRNFNYRSYLISKGSLRWSGNSLPGCKKSDGWSVLINSSPMGVCGMEEGEGCIREEKDKSIW